MTRDRPEEIDVVEFATRVGTWPAGTVGTVVSTTDPKRALVEISRSSDGATIELAPVPYSDLRVVRRARDVVKAGRAAQS